jgi:hypothetical protein
MSSSSVATCTHVSDSRADSHGGDARRHAMDSMDRGCARKGCHAPEYVAMDGAR